MSRPDTSATLLAGLLLGAGALHFARPAPFDAIVPRNLPGSPRTWTRLSGVAECAVGAAVALPATRSRDALAAAGLFLAVLPANIRMARDWDDRPTPYRAAAWARVPLQAPLIGWALRLSARTGR
ncbi:hypothetical protein [Streptomyces sp. AM 3-1-1]|uniref:DoxX family protein n=1 Tax=Streptomyces sp. AM 3-1-1 TaxID=3028711 RepID=UPI0023B99D7E|nr:hypothetical protein [Streptomyces sp. AM 3-1-1]WEH25911.1 hypothetical protein P0D76_00490 [Streptomyces sp. AM 3-1-1]